MSIEGTKFQPRNDLKASVVARGIRFKDVAETCGITPQHLSDVLNGRARLTPRLERQITEMIDGAPEPVGVS
ncbi:MAG: hypothetical protein HW375_26 [Anaerolineales bacterium]|nr:hypothetical protein [Anaerolineales bacterium]